MNAVSDEWKQCREQVVDCSLGFTGPVNKAAETQGNLHDDFRVGLPRNNLTCRYTLATMFPGEFSQRDISDENSNVHQCRTFRCHGV